MDSWEWNKIVGAVLGTCHVCAGAEDRIGSRSSKCRRRPSPAMSSKASRKPRRRVARLRRRVEEALPDFGTVLPSRKRRRTASRSPSAASNATIWRRADPNKIGPNLWGVVGRVRARSHPGFDYSSAMMAKPRAVDLSTICFAI